MKKKLGAIFLVVALALSLGLVPAASVGANSALPTVVWLPPISNQGEFQLKDGSTLPIKFTLVDSEGSFVRDENVQVDVNKVLFRDDFEDNDYSGWEPVSGDESWSVIDGMLYCDPAIDYPRILAGGTSDYENYIFEARAHLVSGRGYALLFRAANYNEFYSFQYQCGAGFQLRLYQFTDFPTGADVAPPVNYTTDYDWHQLKVKVEADNIKCYVDGHKVFDVDDTVGPAPSSGGIGFRTWGGSQAVFDNVMVLGLPAAKTFSYGTGSNNVRISYDAVFSDGFGSYLVGADGLLVWTPVTGDWSVENDTQADGSTGQVYSQNDIDDTNAQRWSLAGDASWTDYVVEAKVKGIEGHYSGYGDNTWDGLVFRAVDDNHFYEYYFRTTSHDIIVVKHDGATRTVVSGPVPFTCQNGVWYTLKVVAEGSSFRFYANDVEIAGLAFTDSSFASGKVGVYVWDGTHAHFDDVRVQASPHYIANLHTKDSGMAQGEYLITVWSGSGDQLGSYLVDLTESTQGKGRGKGKA